MLRPWKNCDGNLFILTYYVLSQIIFNYVNPMLMMQLGWEAMLVTTGQSRPTYAT